VTINTGMYADADVKPSAVTSTDLPLPASTGASPHTMQLTDSTGEQVYKQKSNHNYNVAFVCDIAHLRNNRITQRSINRLI